MTEVGTRGIATADDNLNHYRDRSRGGTGAGGGCLPSLIFKPNWGPIVPAPLLSQGLDDPTTPPLNLKVWIHHCTIPLCIALVQCIEWFSLECRKTKTKVITLANHIGHRQYIEPIKTRSNYMWLTQSAGKCVRARHNWLWFYFWLDEKVARIF